MTWADQTANLQTFTVRRGRPFNLDRCEAGTAGFMFTNGDGSLDPANSNSPYYPEILPLKEIWLSRLEDGVSYNRFRGPIERYKPVWQPPHHQSIGIDAADAFETLANIQLLSDAATLTTALTGANNDLVFTARNVGGQGDDITVEYVVAGNDTPLDADTNDAVTGTATIPTGRDAALAAIANIFARTVTPAAPTALTVQGTDIIVTVATNGAGAPTSTSALIKTALEANADVMALVSVAHAPSNSGAGVVTAMAKTNLSGGKWPVETSGERITRVLDLAAWPADKRAIDDGTFEVASQGFGDSENVTALTHMQDVADSELGYVFIDGNGNFVFHDGAHRSRETRSTVSQATFSDDGTGYSYYGLEITFDKDRIANEVTVTAGGEGAIPQTVEDSGSQAVYGRRTLAKSTLLAHDSDALLVADAILDVYKDPRTRFESISLYMPADSSLWTPAVLGREIGDLVTVRTSPPVEDGATEYTIAYDCFIESIEDSGSPGVPWSVTFQLTPFSESLSGPPGGGGLGALVDSSGDTFTLDSATLGVLG